MLTAVAVTLGALLLAGPGAQWALRQTSRFIEEEKQIYAGNPEALAAIEEGREFTVTVDGAQDLSIDWGGGPIKLDPSLRIFSSEEGELPWYVERDTGRIFSEDGALVVGFLYSYEQNALVTSAEGSVMPGYSVISDDSTVTYVVPGRGDMYCDFFALPALLFAGLEFAAGLFLALPRRLGIGRGLWGKLPLEWHGTAALMVLVGCVEVAGNVSYMTADDTIPRLLRTLFFLNQGDSAGLAGLLLLALFWLGAFGMFQAGASLGMGLRDGFGRYLLCRCWIIRLCAWVLRGTKGLLRRVIRVEFHQPVEKSIAKLLGVNLSMMILFCMFWWMGIVGAMVYTLVAFVMLRRYCSGVQRQYFALRDALARMAEGDLKTAVPALEAGSPLEPVAQSMDKVRSSFEEAVAREVRSQNMKTELITNVSHDLKTPLTAIITYVDLLKDETLPAEQRRAYVATLEKKSQRLKRLIDDLFEVSKAATGNVELKKEPVELGSLLRQVQFELEDQLARSGVDFRWKIPARKMQAVLDGQRTCRVFENLLVNIAKYAMPGTRAYIALEQQENWAVATLKNVSSAELNVDPKELTERFVRGDESRNTEGSGLGLAIAKNFTELQGGRFLVEIDGDLFKAQVAFPLEQPGAEHPQIASEELSV